MSAPSAILHASPRLVHTRPVSYTHLDVYKRQVQSLFPGLKQLLGGKRHENCRAAGSHAALNLNQVPVSYTHLDVYKRQQKDYAQ